jgi:hypothetical protein
VLVPALGSSVVPSVVVPDTLVASVVTVVVVPESVAESEPTLVPGLVVDVVAVVPGEVLVGEVGSVVSLVPGPRVLEPSVLVRATVSSPQATSRAGIKARISARMPAA